MIAPVRTIVGSMSLGGIIGHGANLDLINSINSQNNSTFFGDSFNALNNMFKTNIVQPLLNSYYNIQSGLSDIMNFDIYRPLLTLDSFYTTPHCMQMMIASTPEVAQLIKRGQISGYGWSYEELYHDDPWGRLANNGFVPDMAEIPKEEHTLVWNYDSEDPELGKDERQYLDALRAIELTRNSISKLIANGIDPTDPTGEIG